MEYICHNINGRKGLGGGGKGPSHEATWPRTGTVGQLLLLLGSCDPADAGRAGRQLSVFTWHSILAREQVQWKPKPHQEPISPRMAELLRTGLRSQDCGNTWPLTSDCTSHNPSPLESPRKPIPGIWDAESLYTTK